MPEQHVHLSDYQNFKWFVSEKKDSFLSVRARKGKIDIPNHASNTSNSPFFWNLHNKYTESVACVGCSITYGHDLTHDHKWPSLLSIELGIPTLNFGLTGGGCDAIYVNLKNAIESYNFKTVIINLPDLARRMARKCIGGKWFRWPVCPHAVWDDLPAQLAPHHAEILRKIKNDAGQEYSKRMIKKIIRLCETSKKKYFVTSWDDRTYGFLQALDLEHRLLSKYAMHGPRIADGFHPTMAQNQKFVSSIKQII
jgi:hypothetical protein